MQLEATFPVESQEAVQPQRNGSDPPEEEPVKELSVDLVQDYESFVGLEAIWNRLVTESGIDHPFLRHEWIRTWWDCFDHGGTLYIVLVKEGDDLIGIAPLMLDRGWIYGQHVRRLRGIANVYTERFDFILRHRAKEAFHAIWKFLTSKADAWDMVELRQIAEKGWIDALLPLCAFENRFLIGRWHSTEGPYVPITESYDRFWQSLSGNHRRVVKRRSKRLHLLGEVQHEVVTDSRRLNDVLDEAFYLEAAAWKGQAGTAIISRPELTLFYRQFLKRAAERGWLRLHFLSVQGKRIAIEMAIELHNKLYLLKAGYDPHYKKFTPSILLHELIFRQAWKLGLSEVEFLGASERWKLDWTKRTRSHYFFFVFPNRPWARFVYRLKFALLPRLQKHAAYRFLRNGISLGLRVPEE